MYLFFSHFSHHFLSIPLDFDTRASLCSGRYKPIINLSMRYYVYTNKWTAVSLIGPAAARRIVRRYIAAAKMQRRGRGKYVSRQVRKLFARFGRTCVNNGVGQQRLTARRGDGGGDVVDESLPPPPPPTMDQSTIQFSSITDFHLASVCCMVSGNVIRSVLFGKRSQNLTYSPSPPFALQRGFRRVYSRFHGANGAVGGSCPSQLFFFSGCSLKQFPLTRFVNKR